jgi:hypothetical protein
VSRFFLLLSPSFFLSYIGSILIFPVYDSQLGQRNFAT